MHKSTEKYYRLGFNLSLDDPLQVAIAKEIMEGGRGKATRFLVSMYVENRWLKSQLDGCYTRQQMEQIISMITGKPVQKSTDTDTIRNINDFEETLRQHLLETGILEWADELSEQKKSNEVTGSRKRKSTKAVPEKGVTEKQNELVQEEMQLQEPEKTEEIPTEEEQPAFEYDENASFGVEFEDFLG